MEKRQDIFPPDNREEMGDEDRGRHAGHLEKLLRRLLIEEKEGESPDRHHHQEGEELARAQAVLVLVGHDVDRRDHGQGDHHGDAQPIDPAHADQPQRVDGDQAREGHRKHRVVRPPDRPAQDDPIDRRHAQQRGQESPWRQAPEIIHPDPEQGQEPEDMDPQQAAQADHQGRVEHPRGGVLVVIGTKQEIERQDKAEDGDRRGAERKEIGIRAREERVIEERQQGFLADQHHHVVGAVHEESAPEHQDDPDQIGRRHVRQGLANPVPQGRGGHLAIQRIAERLDITGDPTEETQGQQVGVDRVCRRQIFPIIKSRSSHNLNHFTPN